MAGWEIPLGIVLTIVGGVSLSVQAGVNASLGVNTTKAFAAVISFGMGLAACGLYLLIDATALSKQLPSVADMQGAPWWSWMGGVLGAYYVIVNITFAYKLGAGTAVAVFVCSQLGMSIVLDLTGLVGFQKRAFSWPRITGAALMICGVILVTQFPGAVISPPKPPQDPEAPQQMPQTQQQTPQTKQQTQHQGRQLLQQQGKHSAMPQKLQAGSASGSWLLPAAGVQQSGSVGGRSQPSSSSLRAVELMDTAGDSRNSSSSGGAGGGSMWGLQGSTAPSSEVMRVEQQQLLHHWHGHYRLQPHQHQQQQQWQQGPTDAEVRIEDA